jgi:flagellar protein FlbD
LFAGQGRHTPHGGPAPFSFTDPATAPIVLLDADLAAGSKTGPTGRGTRDPRTDQMITVTRLNGPPFALNPDLIERVEATPDTVITLVDDAKYVVRESVEEIIARVRDSKAAVVAMSHLLEKGVSGGPTLHLVSDHEVES